MNGHVDCECCIAPSDAALLDFLTAPAPPKLALPRRDAALEPLMIAAAAASGPHVTRNHYHHDFFPGVMLPQAEGSWDWTKFTGEDASTRGQSARQPGRRYTYVSKQAPRSVRVQRGEVLSGADKENSPPQTKSSDVKAIHPTSAGPVEVTCMARTRIPTPHGPAFLHLYHNNRDTKEHLAIVIDPAQLSTSKPPFAPFIRSASLDAIWKDDETDMDRITRGAYVGKLSATSQRPSSYQNTHHHTTRAAADVPSPLIRLHSECFTGETIGSMRCDCGEQLDEAIRLISQPITLPSTSPSTTGKTIPGRGAVIYLRQEGRGIGLLSKIRAYNLQDLGHDTVTANLMLGHKADERGYEIAGAILRDLGLGANGELGEGVRLLTNNPDKVKALEEEGLNVVERVPMIPRSWQNLNPHLVTPPSDAMSKLVLDSDRLLGATLIGGNAVYGEDLDKYLHTKVTRMGHMLPLWAENLDV